MPLKKQKLDTAQTLTLEWILHVKNYKLTLDRTRCVGCQICSLACPKDAIMLTKQPKIEGAKTTPAKVDVDLENCNFCGICDIVCPYGAVKVAANGQSILNVVSKESFPELICDIKVDSSQCQSDCTDCETACPLHLITVTKTLDDRPVKHISILAPDQQAKVQTVIEVQKEYCPTCRACEYTCTLGAIKVRKVYEGSISIDQAKCPDGCKDCLDVCPITGALFLDDRGKVVVNETICTYCGACKAVCPVDSALSVVRTKILHTPVKSGAWNKALERLTSPTDAGKEFKAKGGQKARETVSRRFVAEEDIR